MRHVNGEFGLITVPSFDIFPSILSQKVEEKGFFFSLESGKLVTLYLITNWFQWFVSDTRKI